MTIAIRNPRRIAYGSAFAAVLFAILAIAGVVHAQGTETALMNRVNRALHADRRLNGAASYTASPGIIVLYGKVFDEKDSQLAQRTAARVPGVKQVINTLHTSTGQWRAEESRINDTLQINDLQDVSAKVIGPEVYLSGQVSSQEEKMRAQVVAGAVSKLQVVNFIRVVSGPLFSTPNF